MFVHTVELYFEPCIAYEANEKFQMHIQLGMATGKMHMAKISHMKYPACVSWYHLRLCTVYCALSK